LTAPTTKPPPRRPRPRGSPPPTACTGLPHGHRAPGPAQTQCRRDPQGDHDEHLLHAVLMLPYHLSLSLPSGSPAAHSPGYFFFNSSSSRTVCSCLACHSASRVCRAASCSWYAALRRSNRPTRVPARLSLSFAARDFAFQRSRLHSKNLSSFRCGLLYLFSFVGSMAAASLLTIAEGL